MPTTVTGIVRDVDPSEIVTVVVPAAAALMLNVADGPEAEVGEIATMLGGVLVAVKVPLKLPSLAVALKDVVSPARLIVCAAEGLTFKLPACTVIVAVSVWPRLSVTVAPHDPTELPLTVKLADDPEPPEACTEDAP